MKILGHDFKFLGRGIGDFSTDYMCINCKCCANKQDEEYGGMMYMWIPYKNTSRHHFGKFISCNEYIIKNIIE